MTARTTTQSRPTERQQPACPAVVSGGTKTTQQLVDETLHTMTAATGRTITPIEERKCRR